jgi:hypothetical protein
MKKSTANKAIISCLLFSIVISNTACKKTVSGSNLINRAQRENYEQLITNDQSDVIDTLPLDQLIVWRKPSSTSAQVQTWIQGIETTYGPVDTLRFCESCDNSLMLLTGKGIKNYIQGGTASGGKKSQTVPSSGDPGPAYISFNFPINGKPIKLLTGSATAIPTIINLNQSVKIAVLDTGIDTFELKNYPFKPDIASCIPGAAWGWNFIAHNKNFRDDDPTKHGSTVTRFITNEVDKIQKNPIEILPAKTHNKNGVSDLETLLCAFAYAQKQQAKIINASCGFYEAPDLKHPVDPNVVLLKEYVRYYLTNNKILLVAAAGNEDNANEHAAFKLRNLPYPNDDRSLDNVNFFPASLAGDPTFPNVISVTTIDTASGTVSPTQNYSPNVVDIGVNADAVSPLHFVFNNPRLTGNQTVEGSSFATPIVAGKLCANYDAISEVLDNAKYTKDQIWNALGASTVVSKPNLKQFVKNGRMMKRSK